MLNQIKTCEPETKANFILKQYEFIYSYLEIKPRIPGILEAIIESLKMTSYNTMTNVGTIPRLNYQW